ncbi:MAG: TonB-dependent receptor [Pseudomonadales bacterium]|nr:TonB-dependent receptor [Pseudomonadales bacterium]
MKHPLGCMVFCATAIAAPFTFAEDAALDTAGADVVSPASDDVRLQEVIVTVQKREQTAFSVPISFSVFDENKINDLGVQSIEKIGQWTPGVTFFNQSVIFPNLSIRGVTANNSSVFQQPRVSVFQNGVDISRTNGASVAYYDLQHIDVLKGPQGSLFGRGAAIGALNIHQKVAEENNSASVKLTVGSNHKIGSEVVVNGVLKENTLFGRLALFTDKEDSDVDNLAGGQLGGNDTQAVRGSLVFWPTPETQMTLIGNYQKDSPQNTAFINMAFANPDDFYQVNAEAGEQNKIDRQIWDLTLNIHSTLDDFWSLYTVTSYREFDKLERFDADGMEQRILDLTSHYAHKQANQEVRFNFEGDDVAGFIGTNIFWEEGMQNEGITYDESPFIQLPAVQGMLNTLTGSSIYEPFTADSLRTAPPVFTQWPHYETNSQVKEDQYKRIKNLYMDFFSDTTFTLSDAFDLTLGLRATYENLQSTIYTPPAASPSATATALGETNLLLSAWGLDTGQFKSQMQHDFWNYTGRVVGAYRFNSNLNAYASYSRGLRSNVLEYSLSSTPAKLDPETVDSYELGLKWLSPKARHNFNAAVFYYDYKHFRTAPVNNGNPLLIEKTENGAASTTGLEMDWTSLLFDHWRVLGNLAYLDATIDDDERYAYGGDRFRMAPEWSGALGVDYHQRIFAHLQLMLGLNASYQTQIYFEDDNNSFYGQNSQDAYGLLNLHSLLAAKDNAWELRLFIDNILNKEYFLDAGNTGEKFGLSTYVPGKARSYRVSYQMNF